jgi:iron complex transport system substrate-binding protein
MEEGVEEKSKKIAELAPVVGISQGKSIVDLAEGNERLAESLGADGTAEPIAANKQRFEAAVGRFEQASRPSRA